MDNQGRVERGDFETWHAWAEVLMKENVRARPDEVTPGTISEAAWIAFNKECNIEEFGIHHGDWVSWWDFFLKAYTLGAHADE